jgi:predicted transcriptional regulator
MAFTLSTQAIGSLENEIMQLLWQRGPLTVRELHRAIGRDIAYTTVMTTANMLFLKGICTREQVRSHTQTAFRYTPVVSRADILRQVVLNACSDLGASVEERRALAMALTS